MCEFTHSTHVFSVSIKDESFFTEAFPKDHSVLGLSNRGRVPTLMRVYPLTWPLWGWI